jgi:hypothetical protein
MSWYLDLLLISINPCGWNTTYLMFKWVMIWLIWFNSLCLTPLSAIFQLYHGDSHKVYQLLTHGRWFSSGTPASSITKTGRHDIAEILLKVGLNTINPSQDGPYYVIGYGGWAYTQVSAQ